MPDVHDTDTTPKMLQIRADAKIGQTLKRIGAMQEKGHLDSDLVLQGIGAQAGRIAVICAQNKGVISKLDVEPHTLPNDVVTMRVTVTALADTEEPTETEQIEPNVTWNVCYPTQDQTMRTSCTALDKKLNNLAIGDTILLRGAGRALETMLVFLQHVGDYGGLVVSGREIANVRIKNKDTGRTNVKTSMRLWITKND